MRRMTIFITILAIAACVMVGCVAKSNIEVKRKTNINGNQNAAGTNTLTKGALVEFESFVFAESGMSAEKDIIAGYRTEEGVRLVMGVKYYNDEEGNMHVSREINGGEELLNEIQQLLGDADVLSWDGFVGPNPPDILDGTSFSFECVLSDGRKINAHGSNNFPSSYSKLHRALYDMLYNAAVESTQFSNKCYEVTLPDKWVGNVDVCYGTSYNTFFMNLEDGTTVYLMSINFENYEYQDSDEVIKIGRLISKENDEDLYLSVYLYKYYMSEGAGTSGQQSVYETFKDDLNDIIASIRPLEGYELVTQ